MTTADPVEHRMIASSANSADAVSQLLANLTPTPLGEDRFVITVGPEVLHLFGGMQTAQALRCAQLTLTGDRRVNSVHAYFLRRARPELPLEFQVHRDSDGRSFSARRVDVWQDSKKILTMICSFHVPDRRWESLPPMPADLPGPGDLAHARTLRFGDPFDVLEHLPRPLVPGEPYYSPNRLWVRTAHQLPDEPELHDCLLLYVSDMGTPWFFATPPHIEVATSLDHAVWFHQPSTMHDWHYIGLEPVSAADSRGVYTGHIWAADGTQVATIAQENLLRQTS